MGIVAFGAFSARDAGVRAYEGDVLALLTWSFPGAADLASATVVAGHGRRSLLLGSGDGDRRF
jgi:hypothetical protein